MPGDKDHGRGGREIDRILLSLEPRQKVQAALYAMGIKKQTIAGRRLTSPARVSDVLVGRRYNRVLARDLANELGITHKELVELLGWQEEEAAAEAEAAA